MYHYATYEAAQEAGGEDELLNVSITVPRDVDRFSGLVTVAEGLQGIDGLLRTEIAHGKPVLRPDLLGMRAQLVSFRVNSDPVAQIVANLPWISTITFVLVFVRDYERYRNSGATLVRDIKIVVDRIEGLTDRQSERVVEGTRRIADQALRLPQAQAQRLADRLGELRRSISGPNGEAPSIHTDDS